MLCMCLQFNLFFIIGFKEEWFLGYQKAVRQCEEFHRSLLVAQAVRVLDSIIDLCTHFNPYHCMQCSGLLGPPGQEPNDD